MSKVLDMFLEFQGSSEPSQHIGHIEVNTPLQQLREEVGIDISRAVINLPRDVFPWLEHFGHWRQRTLPTGPSNGRTYEGYVLAPTQDPSLYCLVLNEIEPSMGRRTNVYFVRATPEWFEGLEQEFVASKADLYSEVPNGFFRAPETTLAKLNQPVDPEFAARCEGMKPYYT